MWQERTIQGQGAPSATEGGPGGMGAAGMVVAPGGGSPDEAEVRSGFYESLLETSPYAIFIIDWKLRMVFINKAFRRITGFHVEDMVRGRLVFRVHPADRVEAESSILMALVGRSAICQCRVRGWNGVMHLLNLRFSPVLWQGKQLVLCSDIRRGS